MMITIWHELFPQKIIFITKANQITVDKLCMEQHIPSVIAKPVEPYRSWIKTSYDRTKNERYYLEKIK